MARHTRPPLIVKARARVKPGRFQTGIKREAGGTFSLPVSTRRAISTPKIGGFPRRFSSREGRKLLQERVRHGQKTLETETPAQGPGQGQILLPRPGRRESRKGQSLADQTGAV